MQWTERGVQWHGDLGEMGETNEENCQPQLREPSPPGKGSYQGDVSGNKSLRYQGQPENTTILYLSRSPSCYNNWDKITEVQRDNRPRNQLVLTPSLCFPSCLLLISIESKQFVQVFNVFPLIFKAGCISVSPGLKALLGKTSPNASFLCFCFLPVRNKSTFLISMRDPCTRNRDLICEDLLGNALPRHIRYVQTRHQIYSNQL